MGRRSKELDHIATELAFEIIGHTYDEIAEVESLAQIIRDKLVELLD